MNDIIIFSEEQKFDIKWLKYLIIVSLTIPISIFIYSLVQQIIFGIPSGNNPMSDFWLIISGIFMILVISGIMYLILKSKIFTVVSNNSIEMKYFPFLFKKKVYLKQDILKVIIKKYNPIAEFGGWGIRYSFNQKCWAYTISGNFGMFISLTNGKNIMIGTSKPEELNKALLKIGIKSEFIN